MTDHRPRRNRTCRHATAAGGTIGSGHRRVPGHRRFVGFVLGIALCTIGATGLVFAQGAADRLLSAEEVLLDAATLDPAAGIASLQRHLPPQSDRFPPDEAVMLYLMLAKLEVRNGGQPERVIQALDAAEAIATGPTFRTRRLTAAYLCRDIAAVHLQLNDLAAAGRLFSLALPTLEDEDLEAAIDVLGRRGLVRKALLLLPAAATDFARVLTLIDVARRASLDPPHAVAVDAAINLADTRAEMGEVDTVRAAARRARAEAGEDRLLQARASYAEARAGLQSLDVVAADQALVQLAALPEVASDAIRGHALLVLATSRFNRGSMSAAGEAAAEAVEAYRATTGDRSLPFAEAQHTLGTAQVELGNEIAAATAFQSASDIRRAILGQASGPFLATEVERALLDVRLGNLRGAKARADQAREAYRTSAPLDSRPEGLAIVILGLVAEAEGRTDDAIAQYRDAQARITAARGPDSPDLGFSLVRLGRLLTRSGRAAEAGRPIDDAIAIYGGPGGGDTVRLSDALVARAELRAAAGTCPAAVGDARQALALLMHQVGLLEGAGSMGTGTLRSNVRELFVTLARLLLRCGADDATLRDDAFAASQSVAISRAGEALRLTAARLQAGNDALASLLRQRDEAVETVRQAGVQIVARAAAPRVADADGTVTPQAARDQAEGRLRGIDQALAEQFPAAAALLLPRPAHIADAVNALDPDEALLAPIQSDTGMLLWVVARRGVQVIDVPKAATAAVAALVRRIRSGVDLTNQAMLPEFDVPAAQQLHDLLIVPARATGLLRSVDHLILVPDGLWGSFSPHMLVDEQRRWLAERYAISVAPSVNAAIAARALAAQPSRAPRAFLGVGDPVVSPPGVALTARPFDPALERRRQLAELPPLPEAAKEIRAIAALHGQDQRSLLLRERATVDAVLAGQPGQFRSIAFATHALAAGQVAGLRETALVLTADRNDRFSDGLLTASVIATLDLDADIVLLSACNTAASAGGPYAEGLSGLARAFLHAGARSLLVSHWPVLSEVTVRVMTAFAAADQAAPGQRHADALQAAMRAMIGTPDKLTSHPLSWAPFVVVGR
jgi:CHAT domain-containing protein